MLLPILRNELLGHPVYLNINEKLQCALCSPETERLLKELKLQLINTHVFRCLTYAGWCLSPVRG